MSASRKDWWRERKKLLWKLKHGLKITKQELMIAKEIEEIVKLLQLLGAGRITEEEESFLRQRAGKIICDLALEIINVKNDLMGSEEIASNLMNADENLLRSAGYSILIEKVIGGKVSSNKLIRDLLSIWRDKPEDLKRTVIRLLSKDARFIKIERDSFVLRDWPPSKLLQVYVRLASEYRLTNPKKKEKFVREAIKLLEVGKTYIPNRKALIETLKRM